MSLMRAKVFPVLMKMVTLAVNPRDIDLPLYSCDRVYAAGKNMLIVELYDTLPGEYSEEASMAIKSDFSDLPDREPGEHWYDDIKLASSLSKQAKKSFSPRFDELTTRYFRRTCP